DGPVHVGVARRGDPGDDLLGYRAFDLDRLARQRGDPLAADEELVGMPDVHAVGGHCTLLAPERLGPWCQKLLKIAALGESSGLPCRCSSTSAARTWPCSSIR